MNSKSRALVALALAMTSGVCLYLYSRSLAQEAHGGSKVEVLVAASDLPAGGRLTKEQLAVREIPEAYVHQAALRRGEESQVLGRPLSEKVSQGQPLLWNNFELQRASNRRIAANMAKGQRAITVPSDITGSFAGMLRPGDRIDVLATFVKPGGVKDAGQTTTVTLMQNIPVIAIGTFTGVNEANAAEARNGGLSINSMTLSVDPEEAELLVFALQRGSLHFALRPLDDLEATDGLPEKNFSDIFEQEKRVSFTRRHAHKKGIQELR